MSSKQLNELDTLAKSVIELYNDDEELIQEENDGFQTWGNNDSDDTLSGNLFIRFSKWTQLTIKSHNKKNIVPTIIGLLYFASMLRILISGIGLMNGAITLNYSATSTSLAYFIIWMSLPFVCWIISTAYEQYNYHIIKIGGLILGLVNLSMIIIQVIYLATYMFIVPFILQIPLSRDITSGMVLNLARGAALIIPLFMGISAFMSISKPLFAQPEMRADILHYKVNRNLDLRPNKKYAYDLRVTRTMATGKIFSVQDKIRTQHLMVLGATGSGKTSMAFNPGIAGDLDQRIFNENTQKKTLESLLKSNDIILNKDIKDEDFDLQCFRGITKKGTRKLNNIEKKMSLCGLTIIAPNSSFGDDVYDLAIKRGITKINRIDPSDAPGGGKKSGYRGFNPLYLNQSLDIESQRQEIISKSRIFSDVLQALFEEGGSRDVYFSGLNRQFTSSICTMQMKAKPLLHKKDPRKYPSPQVTPWDFYEVINDFPMAQDYYDALTDYLKEHPEEKNNYNNILKLIGRDILGPGAKTMVEQARGLVNQVADLLANPRVRNILCDDNPVDLDEALANNEITILNYELSMGDSDSRALGLFFLLSFQSAVFRRPKNIRPIHFVYIDEYPVLLHPKMSKCFTIFRQYNVCMNVALQSLSQFDEKSETAFMKSVMLSNASTQIVFGRAGLEEMRTYMELGGKKNVVTEQNTISESSLTQEDTSLSYSTRSSIQQVDAVESSTIRNSDFKEAQMITVDKGNPVTMFAVKMNFLTDKQKSGLKRYKVNWHKYYDSSKADGTLSVIDSAEANNETVKSTEDIQPTYNMLLDRRFRQSAIVSDSVSKKYTHPETESMLSNSSFTKSADVTMNYNRRVNTIINESPTDTNAIIKNDISPNISIKFSLKSNSYEQADMNETKLEPLLSSELKKQDKSEDKDNKKECTPTTNSSMDSLLGIDFMK